MTKPFFLSLPRLVGPVLLVLGVFTLSGCGSIIPTASADPTRFYILNTGEGVEPGQRAKTVGIRPVELPGYLKSSRSLVVMTGGNEVRFADFHRWAEPLDAGIGRLVRERLAARVAPGAVYAPPFPSDAARDADVFIRVIRCEGDPAANRSVFVATYQITPSPEKGGAPIVKRYEAPTQSWDGADYAALARALSASVDGMADQIAADLP